MNIRRSISLLIYPEIKQTEALVKSLTAQVEALKKSDKILVVDTLAQAGLNHFHLNLNGSLYLDVNDSKIEGCTFNVTGVVPANRAIFEIFGSHMTVQYCRFEIKEPDKQ